MGSGMQFLHAIAALRTDGLPKSNRLTPLSPSLVDGLLYLIGQTDQQCLSWLWCETPPSFFHLNLLYLAFLWKRFMKQVLLQLREKYWIIHGNTLNQQVLKSCITCRCLSGSLHQKMADLLSDWIGPAKPPFSSMGVDLFGSILVKRGWGFLVRQYGALFTCLGLVFRLYWHHFKQCRVGVFLLTTLNMSILCLFN